MRVDIEALGDRLRHLIEKIEERNEEAIDEQEIKALCS